jgi:hypothetical protein
MELEPGLIFWSGTGTGIFEKRETRNVVSITGDSPPVPVWVTKNQSDEFFRGCELWH